MPLHSTTPFDRDIDDDDEAEHQLDAWIDQHMPDPATKARRESERQAIRWRSAASDYATIILLGTRFTLTSLLIVLGAPLFAFLAIAGWDLALLFTMLANLSGHYLAAAPLRQLAFSSGTQALFIAAVVLVSLIRLPRFASELFVSLDGSART
ncbi:MAG: hypothetical protein ABIM50_04135 [Novosphingobium sp.]